MKKEINFKLENDGFNRYMAVNPNGTPIWESEYSAGICEEEAWDDFVWYIHEGEADVPGALDVTETVPEDGREEDAFVKAGWRMVECEPRPVKKCWRKINKKRGK